ncbi:hypothetical protein PROFUN_13771 [Planoprotostelium fungivorum]|uniref:Uncharacterized protein n=1 Tax=Planoprotostelium fungivorum TaxID=1890364 RepID=A0A2P6N271_9EUKA|nr:hypothetical protein PROFUN_13771 [Planoprotostelium fungivorum]
MKSGQKQFQTPSLGLQVLHSANKGALPVTPQRIPKGSALTNTGIIITADQKSELGNRPSRRSSNTCTLFLLTLFPL